MYARLSTYELAGDSNGEAEQAFRGALRRIDECSGLAEGMYLVSHGPCAITLTLWDSRGEMEAVAREGDARPHRRGARGRRRDREHGGVRGLLRALERLGGALVGN